MARDEKPDEQSSHRIPRVEWFVGALGALLLVAVLSFLVHDAITGTSRPPDIVTVVDSVTTGRGGWLVSVTAENLGDASAADVAFRATLTRAFGAVSTREGRLDYLPGHSRRQLSFVFPVDPRTGKVEIEVLAHQAP